jgi:hypothetical protein
VRNKNRKLQLYTSSSLAHCKAPYARLEVFTAVKIPVGVIWVVTPCSVVEEDGGSVYLRNVGILPQHYTASQPKRPRLEVPYETEWTKDFFCCSCTIRYRKPRQFKPHNLCDEGHKRQLVTEVQTLLETVDNNSSERLRLCDIKKLINSLKLRRSCGIDGIPKKFLSHLPRRLLVHLTHSFNHCSRLQYFPLPWKEAKVITLWKLGNDSKCSHNLHPISLLTTTGKLFG